MKPLFLLFAGALVATAHTAAAQDATQKGKTVLILDASGSMWGQIEGKAKIEIARETAEDLIENRPANLEMGFMAYGHRRKGDCDDIELIVPPGEETTESLLAAVSRIVPKGKTPIFKSVLQAAESLRFTEQEGSIILVSDGIETCDGDLNALGELLAAKGVGFKTHIIGFAMTDEQTVDLRALAEATGGLYADAGDAATLKAALGAAVVAAVKPVTSLSLIPLGEDGTSILKNGVRFALYKERTDEKPLAEGQGGLWKTDLDPGTYHATATFAGRTLEAAVTAAEGRNTNHEFTFTAPVLTLRAVMGEGSDPLADGVSWDVYGQPGAEGKRERVTYSYDALAKLRLAPGEYLIAARRGSAKVEQGVTFTDEPQTVTVVFGAGTLVMTASLTEAGEPIADGLAWQVLGQPDSEGKRPRVANSYDANPTFTVPAGSYLVSVKKGDASATGEVEVAAGKESTGQIVLGSGFLAPQATMSAGMNPHSEKGLKWQVLSAPDDEGKRKSVAYSYDAAPSFSIPSGSYLLKVTRGEATTGQDVEVRSGETTKALLNLNATVVRTSATMVEGADTYKDKGLKWQVLSAPDASGKRKSIAYSYDAEPTFIVPVGSYRLEVTRGNATAATEELAVVAGKMNTTTINLNAGLIKLAVTDAAGNPARGKCMWQISSVPDTGEKQKRIGGSYDAEPTFVLPAGMVHANVTLTKTDKTRVTAEANVEVTAGILTEVAVKLPTP